LNPTSVLTFLGLELDDNPNGAKNLLLDDLHMRLDVGKDGRVDIVALRAIFIASEVASSPFLLTRLDIPHNTVKLELGDLGSLISAFSKRVPYFYRLGPFRKELQEFVVDPGLNEDTRTSAADLTVIEASRTSFERNKGTEEVNNNLQDPMNSPIKSFVQIGVIEDDAGTLSSKLKGHLLQIRLGSGFHNLPPYTRAPSESYLFNPHVRGDGFTNGISISSNKVDNAVRNASLLQDRAHPYGGKGRDFRGLHYYSVASSKRRSDLPGPHED